MSRLSDFYRGTGNDDRGRTLADLWTYSDADLEAVHDFIQWMFPLRERSRFNPRAPVLDDGDVAAFHTDAGLRRNLLRSFEVFLAFLGLAYRDGRVVPAGDHAAKAGVWQTPNHNWLRITRVLTSTRTLGLPAESSALFAFLKGLREGGRSGITADTFAFWERAASG